ncbi:MAG: DNA polymerase/3'-5' exonuclease PolX [Chloroflexi bacterium]|nr:DNA polymerase/3'-5' exonuclease PolX [Chloroflexota bacterium]
MDNARISRVFSDISTLLQLEGEPVFKTRAYSRAADIAANHPVDLVSIANDLDALKEIPGIGNAIALKIQELAETDNLQFYEDLQGRFPAGLLTLLEVPGIGPKTALRASEDLGIYSVETLEQSIEAGEFEKLPRVGKKNADSILRHIRSQRRQSDRHMLGMALPIAERLCETLRVAFPSASNITIAGSTRRGVETVGDLDLLCTSDTPAEITHWFAAMDEVADILGQGDTKTSVVLRNGLQVDLRVASAESFGALLLYFTGSKQHGINLRSRAQSMGLSLNEYGLTNVETGHLESFPTETAVYDRLGLPYIPPEMREDWGEIQRAIDGEMPTLIEVDDIRGDLHVHSDWSDGRVPIEEMLVEAQSLGREYIAITDHSSGRGVANGLSDKRLIAHNEEIDRLQGEFPDIRILKGSEVDIRADGSLDYNEEMLSTLDVVIASVHSAMGQAREVMTERVLTAMNNPHVTAIGHLTTRLLFDGIRSRDPVDIDVEAIFSAASTTGTLLEINASTKRLDLKDTHIFRARQLGARFLINTDSHRPSGLSDVRFGVTMGRRGLCEAHHVVNTLPLDQFVKFIETPKKQRFAFLEKQ